tara:strand:- start:46 stop:282 length:237 start_codon:yes stop_codon:yes gene_type:complete
VYEIKFQGKPVKIFPLKNSNAEKVSEKSKMKNMFLSEKGPTIKQASPKNIERKRGISKNEKGIRYLNASSCVKDIEIQ